MNAHAVRLPTGPMHRPWEKLARLREIAPLVHNITNYVVMNNTANALLAIGASPAMVHAVEEVEEFTGISGALVINIGTLSPQWVEAMNLAAARAVASNIPWVLDPVGAGATRYRTDVAAALVRMHPTVVRGNASEIMVLAGVTGAAGKGVDSAHGGTEALDAARELASRSGAIVAMNDRVDVALAADADGVHVGQLDLSVADARRIVGERMLVGLSVTSMEEARAVRAAEVDYVGVGPVFATASKPDAAAPLGADGTRAVCAVLSVPCVAIGGVGIGNIDDVLSTGVAGVAVISAICAAASPHTAAVELTERIARRRVATRR